MPQPWARAVGPWTGPEFDKEFAKQARWTKGDLIEAQVYHNSEEQAGTVVFAVQNETEDPRILECEVFACEDDYYAWYVFESGELANPGLYRIADGSTADDENKFDGLPVVTIYAWRFLNANGLEPDLSVVQWLKGKRLEKVGALIGDSLLQLREMAPKPSRGEVGGPEGGVLPELGATPPEGRMSISEEIRSLRRSALGEDPPEGRRRRKEDRKRRKALEPAAARGRSPEATEPERKKKKHPNKDKEEATEPTKKKKARKNHNKEKGSSAFQSNAHADYAYKDHSKKRKKRDKKHKMRARKRARKRVTARGGDDSSGSTASRETSPSTNSSEESDSSSQLFQQAPSAESGRANQTRLVEWAKSHPGRLAASQLQQMQDRVGDGEGAWSKDDTPASAKAYYLRVLSTGVAKGSLRNLREMSTLCVVLDHLALGRTRQAADTAAQRLKAVEMACADGHWERAQHLELVPADQTPLTSKTEEFMVAQELKLKAKVAETTHAVGSSSGSWKGSGKEKGSSKGGPSWSNQWVTPWNQWGTWPQYWTPYGGKGKGQKGKSQKGKGKGSKGPDAAGTSTDAAE
jgi:hypothetical protein